MATFYLHDAILRDKAIEAQGYTTGSGNVNSFNTLSRDIHIDLFHLYSR